MMIDGTRGAFKIGWSNLTPLKLIFVVWHLNSATYLRLKVTERSNFTISPYLDNPRWQSWYWG